MIRAAVILAGGAGSRIGGDKPLRPFAGTTLLGRAVQRISPQVAHLIINTDLSARQLGRRDLVLIPDALPGREGPLSGVLAALDWAAEFHPDLESVVSIPADCPFLPPDLVARFNAVAQPGRIIRARTAGRSHPVVAAWPVGLAADLRRSLVQDGQRRVERWQDRYKVTEVNFPELPVDPFFNVNTPEDLAYAERLAVEHPAA